MIKMYTVGKHVIVVDEKSKMIFSKDTNRNNKIDKINLPKIKEVSTVNIIKAK